MNKKNKHMTLEDRLEIEDCLRHNVTFKNIAKNIGKDQTTVSKEVKRNLVIESTTMTVNGKAPEICPNLLKAPFVCNGCKKKCFCRLEKRYYRARIAEEKYQTLKHESREGLPLTKEAFYEADAILTDGVKRGQHIYQIVNANDLGMSVSTVYRNIARGYLSVGKLDLPRAVKFKERKHNKDTYVPSRLKKGRTYADFLEFKEEYEIFDWVEMDTVIGIPGGKVIMTFDFTDINFMFGILLDDKTALESSKKIKCFKQKLTDNGVRFGDIFPVILTDNGGEFSDIFAFINDSEGHKETDLFFCDPYKSCEKPKVEKNHTMFRDIVPKGYSFDSFTQEDVNLIFSHVNSIKRKKLQKKTPYEMFSFTRGEDLTHLLGIREIPADQVIQSPLLLKQLTH